MWLFCYVFMFVFQVEPKSIYHHIPARCPNCLYLFVCLLCQLACMSVLSVWHSVCLFFVRFLRVHKCKIEYMYIRVVDFFFNLKVKLSIFGTQDSMSFHKRNNLHFSSCPFLVFYNIVMKIPFIYLIEGTQIFLSLYFLNPPPHE